MSKDLLHDPIMRLNDANKILYKLSFTGDDRKERVKAAKLIQGSIDELEEILDEILTRDLEK